MMWKLADRKTQFVALAWTSKLFTYVILRMFYTFSPFLVEDWGLSRAQFGVILAAGELAGASSVFLSPLGDVFGNKVYTCALFALCVVFTVMHLFLDSFLALLLLRLGFGTCVIVFSATIQSLAVDVTNDATNNSFVTSVLESAWGMSLLVFVPILSYLYEYTSLQILFATLSVVGALLLIWMLSFLPGMEINAKTNHKEFKLTNFSSLLNKGMLFFSLQSFFLNIPHNAIFTSFAFWAKDNFDVEVDQLGASLFVIGASELLGDLTLTLTNRKFNKNGYIAYQRFVYTSMFVGSLLFSFFLLGFLLAESYVAGLAMVFVLYIPGEFVAVMGIAEVESYVPIEMRTTSIGVRFMAMFLGRSCGAFLGEALYAQNGLDSVVYLSFPCAIASAMFLLLAKRFKRVSNWEPEKVEESEKDIVLS